MSVDTFNFDAAMAALDLDRQEKLQALQARQAGLQNAQEEADVILDVQKEDPAAARTRAGAFEEALSTLGINIPFSLPEFTEQEEATLGKIEIFLEASKESTRPEVLTQREQAMAAKNAINTKLEKGREQAIITFVGAVKLELAREIPIATEETRRFEAGEDPLPQSTHLERVSESYEEREAKVLNALMAFMLPKPRPGDNGRLVSLIKNLTEKVTPIEAAIRRNGNYINKSMPTNHYFQTESEMLQVWQQYVDAIPSTGKAEAQTILDGFKGEVAQLMTEQEVIREVLMERIQTAIRAIPEGNREKALEWLDGFRHLGYEAFDASSVGFTVGMPNSAELIDLKSKEGAGLFKAILETRLAGQAAHLLVPEKLEASSLEKLARVIEELLLALEKLAEQAEAGTLWEKPFSIQIHDKVERIWLRSEGKDRAKPLRDPELIALIYLSAKARKGQSVTPAITWGSDRSVVGPVVSNFGFQFNERVSGQAAELPYNPTIRATVARLEERVGEKQLAENREMVGAKVKSLLGGAPVEVSSVAEAQEVLNRTVEAVREELALLPEQKSTQAARIAELESRLSLLNNEKTALETGKTGLEQRITTLETEKKGLETSLGEKGGENNTLSQRVGALVAENERLKVVRELVQGAEDAKPGLAGFTQMGKKGAAYDTLVERLRTVLDGHK